MMILKYVVIITALILPAYSAHAADCTPPAGYIPIRTQTDLVSISQNLTAKYFLCNDIHLTGDFYPLSNDGVPNEPFTGIFDGNKKTLYDLKIGVNGPAGLFQSIGISSDLTRRGQVTNITFVNAKILGTGNVGIVTPINNGGSISLCTVKRSSVESMVQSNLGDQGVGMIVGRHSGDLINSTVTDSAVVGDYAVGGAVGYLYGGGSYIDLTVVKNTSVTSRLHTAGGLVGKVSIGNPYIQRSSADGTVTAPIGAGGLAGFLNSGNIVTLSSSHAYVTADSFAGGLVGSGIYFSIFNSYARGKVHGTSHLGGIAGASPSTLSYVYASVAIEASTTDHVAGLLADTFGTTVHEGFFDTTLAPLMPDAPLYGRTQSELRHIAAYNNNWSILFTNQPNFSYWRMPYPDGTDFPHLYWESL